MSSGVGGHPFIEIGPVGSWASAASSSSSSLLRSASEHPSSVTLLDLGVGTRHAAEDFSVDVKLDEILLTEVFLLPDEIPDKDALSAMGSSLLSFLGLLIGVTRELDRFCRLGSFSPNFVLDPHIGDTACQLRAVIFAQIFDPKGSFMRWCRENSASADKPSEVLGRSKKEHKDVIDQKLRAYRVKVEGQLLSRYRDGVRKKELLERYQKEGSFQDFLFEASKNGWAREDAASGSFAEIFTEILHYHTKDRVDEDREEGHKSAAAIELYENQGQEGSGFQNFIQALLELSRQVALTFDEIRLMKKKGPWIKSSAWGMYLKGFPFKSIRRELLFLALCYGLSDPSAPMQEKISVEFLKQRLKIQHPKARAKDMQMILSRLSVDWVFSQEIRLSASTHALKGKDTFGRTLFPIYFVSQVLASVLNALNPPVELRIPSRESVHVSLFSRFYTFSEESRRYEPVSDYVGPRLVLCLLIRTMGDSVVSQEREYQESFQGLMSVGISVFLRLFGAVHPQLLYTGKVEGKDAFVSRLLDEGVELSTCDEFSRDYEQGAPYAKGAVGPFLRHAYFSTGVCQVSPEGELCAGAGSGRSSPSFPDAGY